MIPLYLLRLVVIDVERSYIGSSCDGYVVSIGEIYVLQHITCQGNACTPPMRNRDGLDMSGMQVKRVNHLFPLSTGCQLCIVEGHVIIYKFRGS